MQNAELIDFFDKYSNMVFRLAMSYLHHTQDAEDVVQAVFLKFIEKHAVPEFGKERAFLTRITVNHCKDVLRSAWKKRIDTLDDGIIFKQEDDRELYDSIMALDVKYRVVIYMHYYEGYSFSEISDFLKIGSSTVSMRIHRAKKKLKNILQEDNYEV